MFVGRVFVLALCVYLASAHSWMQCADYTEENGTFFFIFLHFFSFYNIICFLGVVLMF